MPLTFVGPQAWGTSSQIAQRKSQGILEFLQQRAGSPKVRRLLLIEENQISQVKELGAFLCEEVQESGLTEVLP